MTDSKLCLSLTQTASELGCSRSLAYQLARANKIPAIRISPRRWVVPRAALEAYLLERVKAVKPTEAQR